jgi:hypothetical protein
MRPLRLDGSAVKTQDMNVLMLPWPQEQLTILGDTPVQLRVTLSYFIEPNPGERGWKGRYRYASHGLRFALKRSLENLQQFKARINRAVSLDEEELIATTAEDEGWYLGRIRDVGSIHSDLWTGSAAELSRRNALAVYPIAGWWKEKPQQRCALLTLHHASSSGSSGHLYSHCDLIRGSSRDHGRCLTQTRFDPSDVFVICPTEDS